MIVIDNRMIKIVGLILRVFVSVSLVRQLWNNYDFTERNTPWPIWNNSFYENDLYLHLYFYSYFSVHLLFLYQYCSQSFSLWMSSKRDRHFRLRVSHGKKERIYFVHLMSLAPIASFVSCLSLSVCSWRIFLLMSSCLSGLRASFSESDSFRAIFAAKRSAIRKNN